MAEWFEAYQAKIANFRRAEEHATKLVSNVQEIYTKLHQWRKTMIVGGGLSGYSTDLINNTKNPTIDFDQWPSVQAMHEALAGYHRAWDELRIAYDDIPVEKRVGIEKPESILDPEKKYSR